MDMPTTCGQEMVFPKAFLMGIGSPGNMRYNFTLNQDLIAMKVMVKDFNVADDEFPLMSSYPHCPILDLKFMEDDGQGNPTAEANPDDIRIDVQSSGAARMEIFTESTSQKLFAGQKLNYVMMAKTASGWHELPG
jgi:hypothetical protein